MFERVWIDNFGLLLLRFWNKFLYINCSWGLLVGFNWNIIVLFNIFFVLNGSFWCCKYLVCVYFYCYCWNMLFNVSDVYFIVIMLFFIVLYYRIIWRIMRWWFFFKLCKFWGIRLMWFVLIRNLEIFVLLLFMILKEFKYIVRSLVIILFWLWFLVKWKCKIMMYLWC